MKFITWLVITLVGSAVLFFICGSTQMYPKDVYDWDVSVKIIFILGTIGWGWFVAQKVSDSD